MPQSYFKQLAAYNRWANARLYEAALALPEEAYRRDVGVFFRSLHGTLNHLLLTDRLWLGRITGEGHAPDKLNAILFDNRSALAQARATEDARIVRVIDSYDDDAFAGELTYTNTSGKPFHQRLSDVWLHLFNHQTHHRGHAHACLSIVTEQEPPTLDLLAMQRGTPAPDLATLVAG